MMYRTLTLDIATSSSMMSVPGARPPGSPVTMPGVPSPPYAHKPRYDMYSLKLQPTALVFFTAIFTMK